MACGAPVHSASQYSDEKFYQVLSTIMSCLTKASEQQANSSQAQISKSLCQSKYFLSRSCLFQAFLTVMDTEKNTLVLFAHHVMSKNHYRFMTQ